MPTTESLDTHAIIARLSKVERQHRRLKRLGICAVLLLAGALVTGMKHSDRVIQAATFELVDGNGKVRAALSTAHDNPGLFLYDEHGEVRVSVSVTDKGPALMLNNSAGASVYLGAAKETASLGLEDRSGASGSLTVSKERASLSIEKGQGFGSLRVDKDGTRLSLNNNLASGVGIGASEDRSQIIISDRTGKEIWRAPQ